MVVELARASKPGCSYVEAPIRQSRVLCWMAASSSACTVVWLANDLVLEKDMLDSGRLCRETHRLPRHDITR